MFSSAVDEVERATPHEVSLVHSTLAERFLSQLPARLIGDNAYESDRLDAELARHGVGLMAPHRRTRTQRTPDGHPLRRYRRRWKVERLSCCLILLRVYEMASSFSVFSASLRPAFLRLRGTQCLCGFLCHRG